MRVIGTAGHVDHGKSTLVKALTGIDPDRLKEEKEREMTIDLGFAWLTLPGGETVSIVDVPGHEAFIKNMLAGVGGIDAAILVIAADEGIMPQTREHLAILDLLQVKGGVVALTKSDLVDPEWLEMITGEVRQELAGTVLANAKLIPVSSRTRKGLDDLLKELDALLRSVSPKNDFGKPRLPIDRVFSMPGFGTIVTGTLMDGSFAVGQEVEIVPGGKRARIRGLQTHKEKHERAQPGSRVAINLSGVSVEELSRGELVSLPGTVGVSRLVDVRLEYLRSAPKPLTHNAPVDFFVGAAEVPAHVRLLDREQLNPGDSGWVQLQLAQPVALAKNDRFIIRFPSPSITIGGGIIVDPQSKSRHRRFKSDVIARLETLARGTPDEIVLQHMATRGMNPTTRQEIVNATGLAAQDVASILPSQVQSGSVLELGAGESATFLTLPGWEQLADKIGRTLSEFHKQFSLRAGMPKEELKSRLGLAPRAFDQVVERAARGNLISVTEDIVSLAGFTVRFDSDLERRVNALLGEFRKSPFASPSAQEAEAAIGAEALNALIAQGKLIRLSDSVVLSPAAFDTMRDWVVSTIRSQGEVTAGQVRDQFNTSRKYAIALLEYLDEKRITRRVGDARVLR